MEINDLLDSRIHEVMDVDDKYRELAKKRDKLLTRVYYIYIDIIYRRELMK